MAGSRQVIAPKRTAAALSARRAAAFSYLPVSDVTRSWDLYVTGVGQETYRPGERYPETGHPALYDFNWRTGRALPEYAMILITAGGGEFEFRNAPLAACTAGDVLLVSPGQWHRYRPDPETGWAELWLCAGGEYLHRLRTRRLMFAHPKVSLGVRFRDMQTVLLEILQHAREHPNINGPLLTAKALEAVALVAEAGGGSTVLPEQPAVADTAVADAIEFIWHNSHRPILTKDVATAINVAPRTLERRFAASHTRAIHDEIEESRYLRARRLLTESTLPIKEIAYSTGFGEPKRMIELFRRRAGATPSEVRARAGR